MQTIKAQLAKIDRVRFLQLTLLAAGISVVLFSAIGTLLIGALYGLEILFCGALLGSGGLFVLSVALGYNPNRRESSHIGLQAYLKRTL